MTRASDSAPSGDPTVDLLAGTSAGAAVVRRAAFARLLGGAAVSVPALAADTDRAVADVRAALRELVVVGLANLDQVGAVVAVGGLSVVPARHELHVGTLTLWSWCAFDCIGIPAALGLDALARTSCEDCGASIEIRIQGGSPPMDNLAVGWLPAQPCNDVQEDFCPQANLFCNQEHLTRWRAGAGDPLGRAADLVDLAALGTEVWAEMSDVVPEGQSR